MSESQSPIPWPVWALVTVLVAAISSPYLYQYLKDSRPSPQSGTVQPAVPTSPQLTYGTWTLQDALDDDGHNWNTSTLNITSQNPVADGFLLKGFFEWRLNGVYVGREDVSGRYLTANRQVILEGYHVTALPQASGQSIAEGSYSAVLSEDGRSLSDGTWGTASHHVLGNASGRWRARR